MDMKVVALTGGIASGKTEILEEMSTVPGVKGIQADDLAKEAYRPGTEKYEDIVEIFGDQILDDSRRVDTGKLAEIIFESDQRRKKLEKVIHPFVAERMREMIDLARDEDIMLLIFEIPLLFQSSAVDERNFDEIILAEANIETRVKRLINRDGMSRKEAWNRVQAQQLPADVERKCDYVISTAGELAETREAARNLVSELLA